MHLKPKKSLGQNFLFDKNILNKIIYNCKLSSEDIVIEIGPGPGELTKELSKKAQRVIAIEIDDRFCNILKERFKDNRKIRVIHDDILKFKIPRLKKKIKIIGNLPYYITTPIIAHLIEQKSCIKEIYISTQKELAKRLIAAPGTQDYSSFSCFVQYHTKPEILFYITKNSFTPVPKVDSAFLRLGVYENPAVRVKDEKLLFSIIRLGFGQRRKMFKNNLRGLFDNNEILAVFRKSGLNSEIRAEELSLGDFAKLSDAFTSTELFHS